MIFYHRKMFAKRWKAFELFLNQKSYVFVRLVLMKKRFKICVFFFVQFQKDTGQMKFAGN